MPCVRTSRTDATSSPASAAIRYAADKGIKIVSSSLVGGSAGWTSATERLAATGGLLVNSTGNFGGADPYNAQWITADNRKAVLFVGALSPALNKYEIEAYSNKAGTMKDRTVVAVGSNVTTLVDGTVGVFSGTSSAAPVVAGLAADILSKWPQLSGQQAGDVILQTARDIGAPGPDEVFGMGLVDFQAALSPVNPRLSNGSTQTSIATSVMVVPTAVGTAAIQTALSYVMVLDAFGRDFTGSIAALVVHGDGRGAPPDRRDRWLDAGGLWLAGRDPAEDRRGLARHRRNSDHRQPDRCAGDRHGARRPADIGDRAAARHRGGRGGADPRCMHSSPSTTSSAPASAARFRRSSTRGATCAIRRTKVARPIGHCESRYRGCDQAF